MDKKQTWDVYAISLPNGAVALVRVSREKGWATPETEVALWEKCNPGVSEARVTAARRVAATLAEAINKGRCQPDLSDLLVNTDVYTEALAAIINIPLGKEQLSLKEDV